MLPNSQGNPHTRQGLVVAIVGEAGVLGPDAGVDDADHDAFAVDAPAMRAVPSKDGAELGIFRRFFVDLFVFHGIAEFVAQHQRYAGLLFDFADLLRCQPGGKAVQRIRIAVDYLSCIDACCVKDGVLRMLQELSVLHCCRAAGLQLLACGGLGGGKAYDVALIGGDGEGIHDNDGHVAFG